MLSQATARHDVLDDPCKPGVMCRRGYPASSPMRRAPDTCQGGMPPPYRSPLHEILFDSGDACPGTGVVLFTGGGAGYPHRAHH